MFNNLTTKVSNILQNVISKCKISGTITADPGTGKQTILAYSRATGELCGSAVWDEVTHTYVIYLSPHPDEGIMLTRRDESGLYFSETYDRLSLCNETFVHGSEYNDLQNTDRSIIMAASKSLLASYPFTIQHENLKKVSGPLYFDKNFKEGALKVSGSKHSLPRKVRGCVYADNDIVIYSGDSEYFETGNINPAMNIDPFGDGSLMACYPMNTDGKDCTGNYPAIDYEPSRFNKGGYNFYYSTQVPFIIPIVITRAATRTVVFSFEHYLASTYHYEIFSIPGLLYVTLYNSALYFFSVSGTTWTNALAWDLISPIYSMVQVAVTISSSGVDKIFQYGVCVYTKAVGIPTVTNNQYISFHGLRNSSTAEVVVKDIMVFNRELLPNELGSLWNTTYKKSSIPSLTSITSLVNSSSSLSLLGTNLAADLKARFPLTNGNIGNIFGVSSNFYGISGVFSYKDRFYFNGISGYFSKSKLLGWWDADDSATCTIATGVSKWLDKSGNGNNFIQSTTTYQPSRQLAQINGRAIARFDGIDDVMATAAKLNAQVVSIFYIQKTTDTQYATFYDGVTSLAYAGLAISTDSALNVNTVSWLPSFMYIDGVLSSVKTRAEVYTALNNRVALVSIIGLNNTQWTGFKIGGLASYYPAIDLGEIIVVPGIPTKEVQQGIEGFLANRWGTTAELPASHPYKSIAPIGTLEEIVAGTDRINVSATDIYIRFLAAAVTAQCIWKKGHDLDGIAVGIDSTAHVTLYARNSNVLTSSSFTTPISIGIYYRFELKGSNMTLYNDLGVVIETKAHGLTFANYQGSESLGAAFGGSPIAGTSGNSGFFNGYISDITFTDANTIENKVADSENSISVYAGETELPVEVVKWDMENNEAILWTSIPELSATEDTVLTISSELLPTKSGVTGTDKASKVWDSEYVGVYHMVPGSELIDSTANRFNGELFNIDASNFVSHDTGYSLNLNGTDEYARIKYPVLSDSQRACITALFRCDTIADGVRLLDLALSDSQDSSQQLNLEFDASSQLTASFKDTSGTLIGDVTSGVLGTVADYNATVNYDGKSNAGSLELFVDNVSADTATPTGNRIANNAGLLHVGKDAYSGTYFDGKLSELHISKKQRSEDWNKVIDLSMRDNLGEYSVVSNAVNVWTVTVPHEVLSETLTDFPLTVNFAPVPSLVYPSVFDTTTVKATSYYDVSRTPWFAVNPALLVTGNYVNNAWYSNEQNTNQKFNIDYGTPKIATRMLLENGHSVGAADLYGIKNFSIYGSNTVGDFSDTTYANMGDLVLLGTFQARKHILVDIPDPQYFYFDNSTAYRYYILRIADNYTGTAMLIRRVSFLASDEVDVRPSLFNACDDPTKLIFKQGTTLLSAEIEQWDATNQKCIFHVKVPSISSTVDTTIDITIGTEANALVGYTGSTAAKAAWDSNYVAVYHMSEDSTVIDSSNGGNPGTSVGAILGSSNFGSNLVFDGNDTVNIPYSSSLAINGTSGMTIESLVYLGTSPNSGSGYSIVTRDMPGMRGYEFIIRDDLIPSFLISDIIWYPSTVKSTFSENYYAVTHGAGNVSHYMNGNLSVSLSTQYSVPSGGVQISKIGGDPGMGYDAFHKGSIGEVRISNIVRSADWLKLTSLGLKGDVNTHVLEEVVQSSYTLLLELDAPTGQLDDFPVTVFLSAVCGKNNVDASIVFDTVGTNFEKIAFLDSGNNLLYAEVEYWDTATKEAVIHVKVPFLVSTGTTTITLDYSGDYSSTIVSTMWVSDPLSTHYLDDTRLIVTRNSDYNGGWWTAYAGNATKSTGKLYWEVKMDNLVAWRLLGLSPAVYADGVNILPGFSGCVGWSWQQSGPTTCIGWSNNGVNGMTYANGDTVMFAVDIDEGKFWVGKNGTWALGDPVAGTSPSCTFPVNTPVFPSITDYNQGDISTLRLMYSSMAYSVPSGFSAWDSPDGNIGLVGSTSAQQVWSNDYVAVYHMNQDPSLGGRCIKDSTSYHNDGTPTAMIAGNLVSSNLGYGLLFNGSTQYITVPASASLEVTQVSMEAMMYCNSVVNNGIIAKGLLNSSHGAYTLLVASAGGWYAARVNSATGDGSGQVSAGTPTTGTWNYLVGTAGSTGEDLYLDGELLENSAYSTPITSNSQPLILGGYFNSTYLFNGTISEIRISNVKRTTAWIAYTNNSLLDNVATITLGGAQQSQIPPTYEGWSGNYITVGPSGKNYTDIGTACTAASSGDLILIYPGDYSVNYTLPTKTLLFRGMGVIPSETVIHSYGATGSILLTSTNGVYVFENLRIVEQEYNGRTAFNALTLTCSVLINKCELIALTSCVVFRYLISTTVVIVRNCYMSRDPAYSPSYYFMDSDISKVRLEAVQLANEFVNSGTGTAEFLDYVVSSTSGYGIGYGEHLLLDITNYALFGTLVDNPDADGADPIVPVVAEITYIASNLTLSLDKSTITKTVIGWSSAVCSPALPTDKAVYWEVKLGTSTGQEFSGISSSDTIPDGYFVGQQATSWGYFSSTVYHDSVGYAYGAVLGSGDIVGVYFEPVEGKLYFSKNGVWLNSADLVAKTGFVYSGITGTLYPAVSLYSVSSTLAVRLYEHELTYPDTVPEGTQLGTGVKAYMDEVSLLIQSETTNGSTTFVDSSNDPNDIVNLNLTTVHSTTTAKFGNSSMYFERNVVRALQIAMTPGLQVGFLDCTIDFFFYVITGATQYWLLSGTGGVFRIEVGSSNLVVYLSSGNITPISFTENQWNHLEIGRKGSNIYLFLNGNLMQTYNAGVTPLWLEGTQTHLVVGSRAANGNPGFGGYIEELRIVKGKAEHTTTFFPPTAPYDLTLPDTTPGTWAPNTEVTAKSVIFDFADDWGGTTYTYMAIRRIEFKYKGSVITMVANFSAYATTSFSGYQPAWSFTTSLPKTGAWSPNCWVSAYGGTPQRLIIVFGDSLTFDSIVINNGHANGIYVEDGVKHTKITIIPLDYTNTTYGDVVADGQEIFNDIFPQHVSADTVDDQIIELDLGSTFVPTVSSVNDATFTIPSGTVSFPQKNIPIMLRLSASSGLSNFNVTGIFAKIKEDFLKWTGTNPKYNEFGFARNGSSNYDYPLMVVADGPRFEKNGSMRFNGTSTSIIYLDSGISRSLLSGTITVSLLVYPELLSGTGTPIFGSGNAGEFQIAYSGTTGKLTISHYGTTCNTSVSLMPNRWNHIIVIRNIIDKTITVYQDKLISYGPTAYTYQPVVSSTSIMIGYTTFTGRIADIQIWNRVLTSDEINYVFNNSGYSIYKDNFVTSLLKQDVPVLLGDNLTSIQATDNTTDMLSKAVYYSLSTNGITYKAFNSTWKSIASSDPAVHGHIGDSVPYYWDNDSQEWVYSNSSIEEAISNAMVYPENRMDKAALNAITDFSSIYSSSVGTINIATTLWSDGTTKPEITSIKINNKNYWLSDTYLLSDYCTTVAESSVNYSFALPDSVSNYVNATKLYCLITGGTQWVECVNGTIPNVPVGLETAGKSIQFRLVWDLSVWVNPADISIEVLIK